jgi:hypothetical protein
MPAAARLARLAQNAGFYPRVWVNVVDFGPGGIPKGGGSSNLDQEGAPDAGSRGRRALAGDFLDHQMGSRG